MNCASGAREGARGRRCRVCRRLIPFFVIVRFVFRAASAVASILGALVVGGCDGGDPAPPVAPPAPSPVAAPAVGPTPLRRLSEHEYLNALHDLFPALAPTLPQLPDDIPVAGFENAAEAQQPSDVLIARYEAIANLYAAAATADHAAVSAIVGCPDWSTPLSADLCAIQFVAQTGLRIFRRPLSDAERTRYLLQFQQWESSVDFEGAVQLTLSAMLQSPQFLYRAEVLPQGAEPGSVIAVPP